MITIKEISGVYKARTIEGINEDRILDGPSKVSSLFVELFGDVTEEHFVTFYLNSKNKLIAFGIISKGTVSETIVHPREIFKLALLANASSIIISHNHPSGMVDPSPQDIQVTTKLKQCGELLGIALLDHVIVNTETKSFYSMKECGNF
jgi:DNA repair protein RadC